MRETINDEPSLDGIDYNQTLRSLYKALATRLYKQGQPFGELTEIIGVNCKVELPFYAVPGSLTQFRQYLPKYPWDHRRNMEYLHYNKLRYALSHAFAENWFYKKEWIADTRRVIALSSDCISAISVYVRNHHLYLVVYFRSSHLTRLLPVDLSFLVSLPHQFMSDLIGTVETFEIPNEVPSIIDTTYHLSFGNLHAHTDELSEIMEEL